LSIGLADFTDGRGEITVIFAMIDVCLFVFKVPTLLEPLDEIKFNEFEIVENIQVIKCLNRIVCLTNLTKTKNAKLANMQVKSNLCYGIYIHV
jgi:hypothetical protein